MMGSFRAFLMLWTDFIFMGNNFPVVHSFGNGTRDTDHSTLVFRRKTWYTSSCFLTRFALPSG